MPVRVQIPDRSELLKPIPVALVLVAVFATVIFSNHLVDFWIYCTSALNGERSRMNPFVGYSHILDGQLLHRENLPFIEIMNSFLAAPPTATIYAVRPLYPLLASILAPLTGALPALLLVNIVAWMAAAYCAVRLTKLITDSSLAPWITVAFIVLGWSYWFHLTDYSAHMLSNCGYVVAVYVLAKVGTAERRLDFRDQAIVVATLAAMGLTYNTGIALLAAYVLFALLSRAWVAAILTAVVVIATQRFWPLFYGGSREFANQLQGTEGSYFAGALSQWQALAADPVLFLKTLGWISFQTLASDTLNFAVVSVCIVGLLTGQVRTRLRWFLLVAGVAPIALAMPWMTYALARGYIASAGFGVLAVLAAAVLARLGNVGKTVAICLVALQAAWLASASLGNVYPGTIFSVGTSSVQEIVYAFGANPTRVESLTGHETSPQRVGGRATIINAGGLNKAVDFVPGSVQRFFGSPRALINRLYLFIPFVVAMLLLVKNRVRVGALLIIAYLLPPIVANIRTPETFKLAVMRTDLLVPAKTVTQEVTLSESAWQALEGVSNSQVELFSGVLAHARLIADLCGTRILDAEQVALIPDKPFIAVLYHRLDLEALQHAVQAKDCDRTIRLQFKSLEPTGMTSLITWQRPGLPARRLAVDERDVSEEVNWPALELRIGAEIGPEDQLKMNFVFF
jgi:hypothetical protein